MALKLKPIRRISQKSIPDISAQLSKQQIPTLNEAAIRLANKNIIYVMNSGGKLTASNAARLLATQSAQSGKNIVLCDTTGQSTKDIKGNAEIDSSGLPIHNINDNLSVISDATGSSFFTSKNFNMTIKDLEERFDQVFLCTSKINSQLGLMALSSLHQVWL